MLFWTLGPICILYAINLTHRDHHFTDRFSIELARAFLQARAWLQWKWTGHSQTL